MLAGSCQLGAGTAVLGECAAILQKSEMADRNTTDFDYGDLPIQTPEQDKFGINGFVASLARSLRGMKSPKGVVIALNGSWGSGKSSAINLLKHHLRDQAEAGDLQIVDFNPWWFRGEEALVLAFFRELYAATGPNLGDQAKRLLPKLGARLLKAGSVVAPAADLAGAGGVGKIASGMMTWLSGMIEDEESVEKLHKELASALAAQGKRFIVVIDDIDRLSPDEAIVMFRLVKSVGRLPNVIYVLAFDRLLAERVVAERFPSEGPHYLEKIVQASFELPVPLGSDLHQLVLSGIWEIAGAPEDRLMVHVMNMFHEILAPEIHTPRDAIRFVNAFSVTWPAVADEVDLGDFVALETYRLFRPAIYQAIRANQSLVTGVAVMGMGYSGMTGEQLDVRMLSSVSEPERFRRGLMRLFPKLESIWGNTYHSGNEWTKERRACSEQHFQTYFRLSLPVDTISKREIDKFMEKAGDSAWVAERLHAAVKEVCRDGQTRASLLLDAWISHAEDVTLEKAEGLLTGIFSVGDDIDVEGDRARGFSYASNSLRIHWLMRALLFERTELPERSSIIMAAAKAAQLGWLADLTSSAWDDYNPREGKEREDEAKCLVIESESAVLVEMTVSAIVQAARDGSLIEHPSLDRLLYTWRDLGGDDGTAVRAWTASQMGNDHALARFARAFTSHSWGQAIGGFGTLGDLVAKRSDRAHVETLGTLMDRDTFRTKLEELNARPTSDAADADAVSRFLNAWDNRGRYG
jgi:predicted KAP-like P-loop ATPase